MKTDVAGSTSGSRPAGGVTSRRNLERAQWRQLIVITAAAIAIYVTLRLLPTGTNLNHMDFRVEGKNSIDFCDPLNPQFIPVVAARSPVTLEIKTDQPTAAGRPTTGVLTMQTAGGKRIAPEDLLVVHDKKLHLMIIDPSLTDYQHVHPQPGRTAGEWTFSFTPKFGGTYRLFADFTPVATQRGLYASVDLKVDGTAAPVANVHAATSTPAAADHGGYRFSLSTAQPLRARQPIDFSFSIRAPDGGAVPLQPVMGAYAHLVAFDPERSGFAHLHPAQADPLQAPDRTKPVLNFKLTIPTPRDYVIWSQVNLGGEDVFVPFWFKVGE